MKRTTENVMGEIRKFLTGRGGAHDWDDFLSIPIPEPINRKVEKSVFSLIPGVKGIFLAQF